MAGINFQTRSSTYDIINHYYHIME
ncbi:hypothetical protein [Robinsoniella peoriensis]